jgi:glycosyltransferase involved in cell wall biosynthesis
MIVERARTLEPGYAFKRTLETSRRHFAPSVLGRGRALIKRALKGVAGLFLQPDPQLLWVPDAYRKSCKLLKESPHDVIFATAPPYSGLLLGGLLKRRFGIPLVLDFRDEWDISNVYLENAQRHRFAASIQALQQRWILRRADAVVATTEGSRRHLVGKLRGVGRDIHTQCIYNGYDADDFCKQRSEHPVGLERKRRFRILYTGTLWNLTSVEPLVRAIEQLNESHPEVLAEVELLCVGRKTPDQDSVLQRIRATRCLLNSVDYMPHSVVIELMLTSDMLCLLLTDGAGAERVVPGKVFEYLAAGRPILAIAPSGEVAEIVRRFHPRGHFLPNEISEVAGRIRSMVLESSAEIRLDNDARASVAEFSREHQAGQLADLLNAVSQPRGEPLGGAVGIDRKM